MATIGHQRQSGEATAAEAIPVFGERDDAVGQVLAAEVKAGDALGRIIAQSVKVGGVAQLCDLSVGSLSSGAGQPERRAGIPRTSTQLTPNGRWPTDVNARTPAMSRSQ